MSIRREVIKQIKNILNEAPLASGAQVMPDDTTGIGNMIPSTHKTYLAGLVEKAKRYNPDLKLSTVLKALDGSLRGGETTDKFYENMLKIYPLGAGALGEKPANFSYAQGGASAKGKTPAPTERKPSVPRYFVCKQPAEKEAVINFQTTKNLNPDGKIGKKTYAAILADSTIKSAGAEFATKGISFEEVLGLKDPKMKDIYQRSVCEALGKTASAWITGGKVNSATDPTSKYGPTTGKIKCPSFIRQVGPYSFEDIQKYVQKYLTGKDSEDLIYSVSSVVLNAVKRNPSRIGCEELVGFIQGAIKTKGRSVPGLSKIETPGQEEESYEMDKLKAARVYASQGITADKVRDPEVVRVGKKYGVFKESSNWIDRTRENTTSNLFERLVKDISMKKVI